MTHDFEVFLHLVQTGQIPTTLIGGAQVPVLCANYARRILGYPSTRSPGPALVQWTQNPKFPYRMYHIASLSKGLVNLPPTMTWEDFAGASVRGIHPYPLQVGAHVFVPKIVPADSPSILKYPYNPRWWTEDTVLPHLQKPQM